MRGIGVTSAVVGAMVSLAAAPAAASSPFWLGQQMCSGGAYQVCASVNVFYDGSGNLVMDVANLGDELGLNHYITAVGLYHLGSNWTGTVSGFQVFQQVNGSWVSGPAGWTTSPPDNTEIKGPENSDFKIELAADYSGTIGAIQNGQTFRFVFALSTPFVIDENTQLRWHSQVVGPDGEPSTRCDTGGLYANDPEYGPCTVVPEPVTMLLVASGLAGLGGAGFLRRRRRGTELVDG